MARIGLVGLQALGAPMAVRLLRAGHTLFLHGDRRAAMPFAERRATICTAADEVAKRADTILVVSPDPLQLQQVLFGRRGLAGGLSRGKAVVSMSADTLGQPDASAPRLRALGCDYLRARIRGDERSALDGTLAIAVEGPSPAFAQIRPVLEALGREVTYG